jgi:hypothetical protein
MPNIKFARFGSLLMTTLLTFLYLCGKTQSQADQKKQEEYARLNTMVQSRQYRFDAQSATAKKGRTVQLSGGYGLSIKKDRLDAELPYYGRAYTTDYPPSNSNGGIKFSSSDFSYVADTVKKGGWDITIKPKNTKVNTIYLTITTSGYCTVRVNSNDRDPISYYGVITGNQ